MLLCTVLEWYHLGKAETSASPRSMLLCDRVFTESLLTGSNIRVGAVDAFVYGIGVVSFGQGRNQCITSIDATL